MHYQRLISAGKLNEGDQIEAKTTLQNVQRILKPIKVINPYAEYLELPQSVFKPRRTNVHYLQFIEAITFYKQHQREHKYMSPLGGDAVGRGEETGELYIETTIEDIQEANELITEVLLRKSDTINGATRNHLENLKKYLKANNQTTFTNAEIRKQLHLKATTLKRYNRQLLEEGYIRKIKGKKGQTYYYEIIDINEYSTLKAQIDQALQSCVQAINQTTRPVPDHTQSVQLNPTQSAI